MKNIKSNLDCQFFANKTGCTLDSGRSFLSQDGAFFPPSRAHLPTTASYPVVGQVKNHSPIHCEKPCMAFRFSGHGARAAKPPLHLIKRAPMKYAG